MGRKKNKKEQVAIEQPVTLPVEKLYSLKFSDGTWLKSWSPFERCEDKADAEKLNSDWARGHKQRLASFKGMVCDIVPV